MNATGIMDKPLHVLYLEDDPNFPALVKALLEQEGLRTQIVVVDNAADFAAALEQSAFDIILVDYKLPTCNGIQAMQAARQKVPEAPCLLISGVINEEAAIESLRNGATDYVPKTGLNRLAPAVCRAVHEARGRAQRKLAETEMARRERHFRALMENSLDVLSILNRDGTFHYNSPSLKHVLGYEPHEIAGRKLFEFVHPEDLPGATRAFAGQVLQNPEHRMTHECRCRRRDGSWCYLEMMCQNRFDDPEIAGLVLNSRDVTQRRLAEEQLKQAQGELAHAARMAGMAEVATSVLHNVGNVLNSVNISASLVSDELRKSKITYIARAAALMREHAADIGDFMAHDPKGRQLPGFLNQLAEHLAGEQAALLKEMALIRKNLDHIKDVVSIQQSYSKISGSSEKTSVTDLVEDALRMNTGALIRHEVELVREFESNLPEITVQKHKVLQILINLIRNAKYACDESNHTEKRLTLRVANGDNCVRIAIIDNGVGIPAENLTRIFNHGFTTRKGGHGFGLHSSLAAAREMSGALLVHSDGPGQGATFTLELPLQPPPD